ncbi:MAG TPA: MFS transporter [Patescibacteria group bacterium]|nr:MFS transporter [Patescibacteria group bacterium]
MGNASCSQIAGAPVPIPAPPPGKYRWLVCALLFFATTVNYMDRQILSLLKEVLDQKIGWTNEQFGFVNSVFQIAYGAGLLGFGWLVDRFGTKIGYSISICAWSVAAAAHALVGSFGGFAFARGALGLGEGGNFPSAIKAVTLWFPKAERAFATSIFNAGTNAGALIAPAVVPWVAFTYGWQAAFVAAGLAGFVWLCFWLAFYEVPEKSKRLTRVELNYIQSTSGPTPRPGQPDSLGRADDPLSPGGKARDDGELFASARISWSHLLCYSETWSFITAKFLTDPVWWFFLIWLPDFFKKTRGLDIKHSWPHIVTIYGIVTVLSIFGGWITGYLSRRGWSITRARKTGMFIFALCALPVLGVTAVGNWTAVLLIGLAASAHQAWSANLYTTVSDIFPKEAVGSVIGIGGMAGSAGGFFFPILTGYLVDLFQARGNATPAYAILFGICACMYLIAFAVNHLCAPRFEPLSIAQPPNEH